MEGGVGSASPKDQTRTNGSADDSQSASPPHSSPSHVQRSHSEQVLTKSSPAANQAGGFPPRVFHHQHSEPFFKVNSPHDAQEESPRHNKWGMQVLLSASPSVLHPGEKLTLVWGVTEGTPDYCDWIGMFRVGEDHKHCLQHHYCGREKRGGTWHPTAPLQPGDYEFRFMKSSGVWPSTHPFSIKESNTWTVSDSVVNHLASAAASAHGLEALTEGNPPHLDLNRINQTWTGAEREGGDKGETDADPHPPPTAAPEVGHPQPVAAGSAGHGAGHGVLSALSQLLSPHVSGISNTIAPSPPASGDSEEQRGAAVGEAGGGKTRVCGTGLGGPRHNILQWFSMMSQQGEEVQMAVEFDEAGALLDLDTHLQQAWHSKNKAVLRDVSVFLLTATEDPRGRKALLERQGFEVLLHLCMDDNHGAVQAYACKALMNLADDAGTVFEDMNVEENRLRSFAYCWPHAGTPLTPEVMAAAGFYFAPRPDQFDRTVCFQCKTAMMAWDADEDPLVEHRRIFAACHFLTDPAATSNVPVSAHERPRAAAQEDSPVRPAQHGAALFQLIQEESPACDLLALAQFEPALVALQRSADLDVQRLAMQLLAQLSTSAGDKDKFAAVCLPRFFDTLEDCKDPLLLVFACQALAHLASQPICRDRILTSPRGADAVRLLVSALPKWCSHTLERSEALIVNCLQALSYLAQSAKEQVAEAGGAQAVLLVLRERKDSETEVMRWAVAALRHLAILRVTHPDIQADIRRLVHIVTSVRDLHVQSDAGRVLAILAEADPAVLYKVARQGLPSAPAHSDPALPAPNDPADDPDRLGAAKGRAGGAGGAGGGGGGGEAEGLEALRFLARRSTSRDVVCQRFAAQALWCMAKSVVPSKELYGMLVHVGFEPGVAGLALRLSGERTADLVVWCSAAGVLKSMLGEHEEAAEGTGLDLQAPLLAHDGLEMMCGLLQQEDRFVRLSGLKALVEVTRKTEQCVQLIEYKALEWAMGVMRWEAGEDAEEEEAARELQTAALELLANVCACAACLPRLHYHGAIKLLARAAKAKHPAWQRHAARGLALLSGHPRHGLSAQQHPGLDWIPSPADASTDGVYGLSALLGMSHSSDTAVQAWAAQGLLNACEDGVAAGWPDAMIYITTERRVHSIMHLVYSSSPWVARTAMKTLAALSTLQRTAPLGDGRDALLDSRRALFLTGVMFPTIKIGMVGDLEETRAAAIIVANLATDPRNVEDMVNGSESTLNFAFHIASFHTDDRPSAPAAGRRPSHRTSPLTNLIQNLRPLHDKPGDVINKELALIRQCGLQTVKIICHNHSFHTRFVERGGLQLLMRVADWVCPADGNCKEPGLALLVAQAIEGLACNKAMHELLVAPERNIKGVIKRFFKASGIIPGIDEAAERALVALNAAHTPTTPNPPHPRSGDDTAAEEQEHDAAATHWRIKALRAKDVEDKRAFKMASDFTYDDLYNRLLDMYRDRPRSIAYEDEDEEWIVLADDDDLQEAKSANLDPSRRKLRLRVGLESEAQGSEAGEHGKNPHHHHVHANPTSHGSEESSNVVEKTLMESHLTDSNHSDTPGGSALLRWQLGKCIGRGAFAQVFQGINADTGELMAVKQVTIGEMSEDYDERRHEAARTLQREIDIMRQLQHKHIVKYLGTDQSGGRLNIFLEWCSGGSIVTLLTTFGAFEEPVVRKYTYQILVGLDFLHSQGFVHCDIKGGNILVSEDGVIKLADFNSSKLLEGIAGAGSNPLKSMLGTPQFMAPEVIRQTGHGKKADIWSVGCTVIQMLDGHPPWDEITNKVSLLFHIASSKEPPRYPKHISAVGRQFLDRCFRLDPKERATCKELLRHPWLDSQPSPAGTTPAAPPVDVPAIHPPSLDPSARPSPPPSPPSPPTHPPASPSAAAASAGAPPSPSPPPSAERAGAGSGGSSASSSLASGSSLATLRLAAASDCDPH